MTVLGENKFPFFTPKISDEFFSFFLVIDHFFSDFACLNCVKRDI